VVVVPGPGRSGGRCCCSWWAGCLLVSPLNKTGVWYNSKCSEWQVNPCIECRCVFAALACGSGGLILLPSVLPRGFEDYRAHQMSRFRVPNSGNLHGTRRNSCVFVGIPVVTSRRRFPGFHFRPRPRYVWSSCSQLADSWPLRFCLPCLPQHQR
jgi:hypothetical protein